MVNTIDSALLDCILKNGLSQSLCDRLIDLEKQIVQDTNEKSIQINNLNALLERIGKTDHVQDLILYCIVYSYIKRLATKHCSILIGRNDFETLVLVNMISRKGTTIVTSLIPEYKSSTGIHNILVHKCQCIAAETVSILQSLT